MHFPFSPGTTSDDKIMTEEQLDLLIGPKLIFTEKLDGSNVCLTNKAVYSRSHAGPPAHKSFNNLKARHAIWKNQIPEGISIFGEWCYAVHSIRYSILQNHFNVIGVRDDVSGKWLDWEHVELWAEELDVPTVPVILKGALANKADLKEITIELSNLSSIYGREREGLVVRTFEGPTVNVANQLEGLAKWVRKDHVKTDIHWKNKPVEIQPCIW